MQRSVLVALLATSVVLAGCSGLWTGSDETTTETLTPAEVPTDEPTQTPVPQLAPGLTGNGVTDALALGNAHAAVLDNTSYTLQENSTIQFQNGTIFNQATLHVKYMANDSQFYIVQDGFSANVRGSGGLSLWSNGERVLLSQTSDNTTSYRIPRGAGGEPVPPQEAAESIGIDPTNSEQISGIFGSVETRVTNRTIQNGTPHYRVVATNITNSAVFRGSNPRNITLQTLISSQGLIHNYRLNYTATLNGNSVRIHRQINYTNLGNTTIKRPPWYDAAIENISTATSAEST